MWKSPGTRTSCCLYQSILWFQGIKENWYRWQKTFPALIDGSTIHYSLKMQLSETWYVASVESESWNIMVHPTFFLWQHDKSHRRRFTLQRPGPPCHRFPLVFWSRDNTRQNVIRARRATKGCLSLWMSRQHPCWPWLATQPHWPTNHH